MPLAHHRARAVRTLQRLWSIAGLLIAGAIAVGWHCGAFLPALERLDGEQRQLDVLTDYLRRAHEIQRTFLDVSTSCEALQQVHQRNCDRIDNATDEVAFLAWMTKESTDWKLALKDFRPGAQVAYGDHDGRSLHMSGAGSYESICRMLNDLRTCPRMNRIASLSIVPFNAERTQFDVNLQVELLTSTSK